jgi:predicted esterase
MEGAPSARRLAIFLHGLGDRGLSFRRLAHTFSDRGVDFSTPTAPLRSVTLAHGAKMTAWFDLSELPVLPTTPYDEEGFSASTTLVHGWLNDAIASGTPATSIYLCGFSQGAALAVHAGISYPAPLGGIIAFAGWMPGPSDVSAAQATAHTRVLLVHGTLDTKVPAPLSEDARARLEAAGLSVRRIEFTGYHELGPNAVRLMDAFFRGDDALTAAAAGGVDEPEDGEDASATGSGPM